MDLFMELPSPSPATPNFALRFERLGWTRVPVKLCVMDIPWGVALRAPVQGLMKRRTRWQRETQICTKNASGFLSVLI
jgi:hypothetical protein